MIFSGKVFSTTLLFTISKVKILIAEIVWKKCLKRKILFFLTILEECSLIFKIGSSRIVENISLEKNSHDL